MKTYHLGLCCALLFAAPIFADNTDVPATMVTTKTGLQYEDTVVGTGPKATAGKTIIVQYTGWLNKEGKRGKKFDSSYATGRPFTFLLGRRQVIKGWDEGVQGMQVGGKRTLWVPSKLGYGRKGAGDSIPPNADLIFDVELLEIK
jgi:FKBP-type peptidyl-prolyl cis-trans isomerase